MTWNPEFEKLKFHFFRPKNLHGRHVLRLYNISVIVISLYFLIVLKSNEHKILLGGLYLIILILTTVIYQSYAWILTKNKNKVNV